MRRTDDVSLWPWPLTLKLVCNSTCRGVPSCKFWYYYDYSFSICVLLGMGPHRPMSVGRARRNCYQSIGSSKSCCLHGWNWQITGFFGDKILDLESDFRKLGSGTILWSLIRILRVSLVQTDTEMAEKYAKQQQPAVIARYAVSSDRKIL